MSYHGELPGLPAFLIKGSESVAFLRAVRRRCKSEQNKPKKDKEVEKYAKSDTHAFEQGLEISHKCLAKHEELRHHNQKQGQKVKMEGSFAFENWNT